MGWFNHHLDNGSTPHPFIQKSETVSGKLGRSSGSIPRPLDRTGPSTSADFTFSFFKDGYQVIQAVTFSSLSWRSLNYLTIQKGRIARYSTNCWFGSRWFGIRIRVPLSNNPFHFRESFPEPNHQAPNHQFTINWWLPSGELTWQLKSPISIGDTSSKRSTFCCHVRFTENTVPRTNTAPMKNFRAGRWVPPGCFSSVQFDILWQIWSEVSTKGSMEKKHFSYPTSLRLDFW